MSTIIGMGAKKAPSTVIDEELKEQINILTADNKKLNEDLKKANDTIEDLEAKNKDLEAKITGSNNQSVQPDADPEYPGKADADPNDGGSKKKTKKDE